MPRHPPIALKTLDRYSEIVGSKGIRTSPTLIAAYHVLHRLCMPRHPPIALKTLDRSHCQCPSGSLRTPSAQKDQLLEICSRARLGKPIISKGLSVPCDRPPMVEFEQIFSSRCKQNRQQAYVGSPQTFPTNDFRYPSRSTPLQGRLVEPDGIEPTTSCLQSRRSPS